MFQSVAAGLNQALRSCGGLLSRTNCNPSSTSSNALLDAAYFRGPFFELAATVLGSTNEALKPMFAGPPECLAYLVWQSF